MKELDKAREEYENVPIPKELEERVREGIRQGTEAHRKRVRRRNCRWFSAAACFAVLLAGLNAFPGIAHAASDIPVLGRFFQVLTFVEYDRREDDINYDVSIPQVEAKGDLAEKVNQMVQDKVEQHLEQARRDWADYRDAFFATGGTEETWGDREMGVIVNYEIKSQTDTRVSFMVYLAEGWVTSKEARYYYNLDLAEDREVTLCDVLGEEWIARSNTAIREQIARLEEGDAPIHFFAPENGGFTSVDEDSAFYIREDGIPVVVFPRYTIADGAAGVLEFPVE